MVDYKVVKDRADFEIAYNIRLKVFVEEQKVPIELELDEYDSAATHIIVYDDNIPVGCGRIVFLDEYAKIGRVAVLQNKRNKGFGREICKRLIEIAKENRESKILIHAQIDAVEFYRKLGFYTFGDEFDEAGIRHITMIKEV